MIYNMDTKNKSFLDMYYFLKKEGITNNKFFLSLQDESLINIDPRDPNLDKETQIKIFKECESNYWYFLREVVRVMAIGSDTGVPYTLDRGLLAYNFALVNNFPIIMVDLPMHCGKNMTIDVRVLWEYIFNCNYSALFIDKDKNNSIMDLHRIKDMYKLLPSYLRNRDICEDKTLHIKDEATKNLIGISNKPKTKVTADNIGRGYVQDRHVFTDFQFLPYNEILYNSSRPARYKAYKNAEKNGIPFGTVLLTSGGDLSTKSGLFADTIRDLSVKFSEQCYDANPDMLKEHMYNYSLILYIRFDALDLQKSSNWLSERLKSMNNDWEVFIKEIFTQWR